jgi:hypothetical protein
MHMGRLPPLHPRRADRRVPGALDEDFSLETLRDQLAFAATYPDEAFSRYGAGQELITEVKAWALSWSTEISTSAERRE